MANLKDIISLIPEVDKKDKALIEKAYNFAKEAHKDQKRNSGEPYFTHVAITGKNLAEIGMDTKTIVAGILHDILEDTETTEEELRKKFGKEILTLVTGVTKLGTLKYSGDKRRVESLRKFFMAITNDIRILIIKLADRLHNIETLKYVPKEKQERIALETIEIYARLADRIGMGKLKGQLEDAAFPFAYPKEYEKTNKMIKEKSSDFEKELDRVSKILKKELKKEKINVVEISQRVKYKYSLWCKLKRYNMDIDKIYDIVALRVIVDNTESCYRVLGLCHTLWKPLPGRIKDYIANKKPNGYRSLHTTVFTGNGGTVEIQIRTPEMHAEAAHGIAAHFIYKDISNNGRGRRKADPNKKKLKWLNQLKEMQDVVSNPTKFIDDLKMDLFRDRIFVFTPNGDVVDLPENSSTIDFAYAIHSDIGNHAQSAKVNGKMVSLNTKLQNNDIIEIKTNKKAQPSSKWLSYTKTTTAHKYIKAHMKENDLLTKFRSFVKF